MQMFFLVQYADIMAQNPATFDEKLGKLGMVTREYKKIVEEAAPLCLKDLDINGKDLIEAGIKPGPVMGKILGRLLEIVIDEPDNNQKDILLSYVKEVTDTYGNIK